MYIACSLSLSGFDEVALTFYRNQDEVEQLQFSADPNPKPQSLNSSCQSCCAGRCCFLSVLSGMLLETRKWWMVAVAKMGVLGPKLELLRLHSCKGKSSAKKKSSFQYLYESHPPTLSVIPEFTL